MENTTDFEERREIRQQLRELRKKKLDALQSDTTANERPRRRERLKREEQSSVITETKTTSVSDSNSSQPTQTTIEVNYSRTVVTEGPSENGIENGHVESEKYVEEETICVEDETPVEEQPVEVESGTNFTVQINGEKSPQDRGEEQGLSEPQEISTETEIVVETSETATDGKEEDTEDKEEEMEEVELTPEVIEKMEDVDQLEKLVRWYLHCTYHKIQNSFYYFMTLLPSYMYSTCFLPYVYENFLLLYHACKHDGQAIREKVFKTRLIHYERRMSSSVI